MPSKSRPRSNIVSVLAQPQQRQGGFKPGIRYTYHYRFRLRTSPPHAKATMTATHFSRPKSQVRILLLEGVHPNAVDALRASGFNNIEEISTALAPDELASRISDAHYLGIRSRSQITNAVLSKAQELRAIGCFCIGTNQVDLSSAQALGIPVFNAPFSNTRSVAELVLAEAIMLARDVPAKNARAHQGVWEKSATGSFEIRGKNLGIIGYGHIGTQVGLLAEAVGMRVFYYDTAAQLTLGNATPIRSLNGLLEISDFVTLHVPAADDTVSMIGAPELARMKPGASLINASRGTVVDIEALADALTRGHLKGAAVDVFPVEPSSNQEPFESPLTKFENVILTPHVGGSTEEAQGSIGLEVSEKLVRFHDNGSTVSAVNFPQVSLPTHRGTYRLLHIHRNQPGVLASINRLFSNRGINIAGEFLQTNYTI
ncbi:MAG: D-3-phosphoglycerate dehydrogenase, partial [Gammaproteobacteria bacterium]